MHDADDGFLAALDGAEAILKSVMERRICVAARAPSNCAFPSVEDDEDIWASMPDWEASWTSKPAVKALGPAPVRRMARTAEEYERV
jgi:hypothetical protein